MPQRFRSKHRKAGHASCGRLHATPSTNVPLPTLHVVYGGILYVYCAKVPLLRLHNVYGRHTLYDKDLSGCTMKCTSLVQLLLNTHAGFRDTLDQSSKRPASRSLFGTLLVLPLVLELALLILHAVELLGSIGALRQHGVTASFVVGISGPQSLWLQDP